MIRHGVRVKRWLLLSFVFSVKGRRRQTQGGAVFSTPMCGSGTFAHKNKCKLASSVCELFLEINT